MLVFIHKPALLGALYHISFGFHLAHQLAGMDSSQGSHLLTDRDKRLLHLYGKIPTTGHLSHHQPEVSWTLLCQQLVRTSLSKPCLQERKYFDSGDFALSQARQPSNIGAVETGSKHPLREDISRPSCPVPNSSNVESDANQQLQGGKNASVAKRVSHLHQEIVGQTVDSKEK